MTQSKARTGASFAHKASWAARVRASQPGHGHLLALRHRCSRPAGAAALRRTVATDASQVSRCEALKLATHRVSRRVAPGGDGRRVRWHRTGRGAGFGTARSLRRARQTNFDPADSTAATSKQPTASISVSSIECRHVAVQLFDVERPRASSPARGEHVSFTPGTFARKRSSPYGRCEGVEARRRRPPGPGG